MIFAIVAILGLSAVCGKMIALVYEKRDKFYEELETFCMFMKNEIGFCQTKAGMIFDKFVKTFKIKNFEAFKELKSCVENKNVSEQASRNLYFLKQHEKQMIYNFFKNLGSLDENHQVADVENFAEIIKKNHEEATGKRKQNAPLCYKLCLAVGAVVCVMIL